MEYGAASIIGYLLGSVPVALWVARRHGVDLRRTADGNPGAWNALEQLGAYRAWPAFLGDGLKGTLAGLVGLALGGIWVAYAAVAAAMLGHAFPAFARFRGGKSVMCFAGGMFALSPLAALLALAACLLVALVRRSFAAGARVGVFGVPLLQLLLDPVERVAATGALMTLIGALFVVRRLGAAPNGPASGSDGPTGQ
ncbi:MAG: glycerol-3-phosphate acyltransferase [Solirubrobacterales bacterium]|nr:glycerol-3-phosphate acyltransferase [Solirubrobacterales bacterium]